MMDACQYFTQSPIDFGELEKSLNVPECGAVVIFTGKVRNHHQGKSVTGLSYEAYIPMAEKVFKTLIHEAKSRYPVHHIEIRHRTGDLKIGDIAVWVGVNSAHRAEAFQACMYVMDELKKRAPIWKKEHYAEEDSQWVLCTHT